MTFHTNVNNIVDYQCKNFNKNDWKKYTEIIKKNKRKNKSKENYIIDQDNYCLYSMDSEVGINALIMAREKLTSINQLKKDLQCKK